MANWKEVTERWLPIVEHMEEHSMDDYAIPEIYRAAENGIDELKRENKRLTDVLRYIQATRPYGIERAIDYQAWLTKRIGALLTAEESG